MKKLFSLCLMACVAIAAMAQSYPEKVYLTGSATPVGWSTNALPMFSNGDGTYEYVGMLYNGEYGNEFKMLGAADWLPSYGPLTSGTAIAAGQNYDLEVRTSYEMNDNKFTVTANGRYHLTLNLTENKLYVEAATEDMPDKDGFSSSTPEHLYIVGNGTGAGWSAESAFALTTEENGTYTITTTIYGHTAEEEFNEFKFLTTQTWDMPHVGPANDGEVFTGAGTYTVALFVTGDKKYHNTTTETKVYDFVIDLSAHTMTVTEHVEEPTALDEVVGNVGTKKMMINGQLYILNNEAIFTATGARVK